MHSFLKKNKVSKEMAHVEEAKMKLLLEDASPFSLDSRDADYVVEVQAIAENISNGGCRIHGIFQYWRSNR